MWKRKIGSAALFLGALVTEFFGQIDPQGFQTNLCHWGQFTGLRVSDNCLGKIPISLMQFILGATTAAAAAWFFWPDAVPLKSIRRAAKAYFKSDEGIRDVGSRRSIGFLIKNKARYEIKAIRPLLSKLEKQKKGEISFRNIPLPDPAIHLREQSSIPPGDVPARMVFIEADASGLHPGGDFINWPASLLTGQLQEHGTYRFTFDLTAPETTYHLKLCVEVQWEGYWWDISAREVRCAKCQ